MVQEQLYIQIVGSIVAPLTWIYIAIVLVLLYKRRDLQPLKCRAPPLLAVNVLVLLFVSLLIDVNLAVGRDKFPCVIFSLLLFSVPLYTGGVYLKCRRILLVFQLNTIKSKLRQNKDVEQTIRELNHKLSSRYNLKLMAILLLLLLLLWGAFVGAIPFMRNTLTTTCTVLDLGYAARLSIIIALAVFLALFFPIIIKAAYEMRHVKEELNLKRELLYLALIVVFNGGLLFFGAIFSGFSSAIATYDYYFPFHVSPMFFLIVMIYNDALHPIILTWKWQKQNSNAKQTDMDYHRALADKGMYKLFKEYCDREFSSENYLAWEELQRYLSEPDIEEKGRIAVLYFETYLADDAPMPLNIDNKLRNAVSQDLKSNSNLFSHDVFERVNTNINTSLVDIFLRFKDTTEYEEYVKQDTMLQQVGIL